MGAVYSVCLKKSYRKNGEKEVFKKLTSFVDTYNAVFHKETFEAEGVDLSTADGLIQVCLAGYARNMYDKTAEGGYDVHTNDFDASYGWERVMEDMFDAIAPYLEDDSCLDIDVDGEFHDSLIIKNGKCKQII